MNKSIKNNYEALVVYLTPDRIPFVKCAKKMSNNKLFPNYYDEIIKTTESKSCCGIDVSEFNDAWIGTTIATEITECYYR